MARTPEERLNIATQVMELLSEGSSMRDACERLNVPFASAHAYCHETQELSDQYARARECGALYNVEGMPQKIREARERIVNGTAGTDTPTYARMIALEIDALKWQFSKTARGLFGDSSKVEHSGKIETSAPLDPAEALAAAKASEEAGEV